MSKFEWEKFDETNFNEVERFFRDSNIQPIYDTRSDYTTNAPSFYEYLARHNHLIKILAQRIYDYDKELAKRFIEWGKEVEKWNNEIDKRMEEWDKLIKKFPENVENLLIQWLEDGTLDHIINETLMNQKVDKDSYNDYVKNELIFNNQTDFTKLLNNETFSKLHFKKINDPYNAFSVFTEDLNQDNHITHEFRKNANDDFYIYHTSFLGKLVVRPTYKSKTVQTHGTGWSTLDNGFNQYTTNVGDYFIGEIKGKNISFNHLTDRRGGKFEFILNNDPTTKKVISTYSNIDQAITIRTKLFDNLDENVTHEIKGTYIGADERSQTPENSRGWIKNAEDYVNPDQHCFIGGGLDNGIYRSETNTMLSGYGSNKEFALNVSKNNDKEWFPEHNNKGTAFNKKPIQVFIDNKLVNTDSMNFEETIECSKVEIVQNIYFKLPNTTNLAEMEITYEVTNNGIVNIYSKLDILEDITINDGYFLMFVVNGDFLDTFVTGINSVYKTKKDNSSTFLITEKNRVNSYVAVSEEYPDYYATLTINTPIDSLRLDENDTTFFIHERVNYPKLYPTVFKNEEVKKGSTFKFSGSYSIGTKKNIYNLLIK